MEQIIGDKKSFALGIDIVKYDPWLWGKSCIWINDNQIGNYEDENILGPFIQSLMRIAIKHQGLWLEEFNGLACKEIFTTINPFNVNPEKFYELSDGEQEALAKYDVFNFQFGENFDYWNLYPVVKGNTCKFIWNIIAKKDKNNVTSDDIQCFDVPLNDIQEVYREFCRLIPEQYWPSMIEKLR